MRLTRLSILACLLTASMPALGYKDAVGFSQLAAELGTNLPTGAGVKLTQVEASVSTNSPVYFPDTNHVEFAGKTITDISAVNTGNSGHAGTVGRNFYATNTGMAAEADTVDVYFADEWLGNDFLRPGLAPKTETSRVQNHSWIGITSNTSLVDRLVRLDFAINRDGFTAAVGLGNSSGGSIPLLLGSGYHSISVGRTSGSHSSGTTLYDGTGRTKPELVSVAAATSFSTPHIGAAAAILIEAAEANGYSDAARPQTMKAILMAGATKQEFPDWDRTHARPIDETFGAGELNVYQSYHILDAGPQPASNTNTVPVRGWDYQSLGSNDTIRYFFNVPSGYFLHRFSFMTTWHRIITDTQPGPGVSYSAHLNNVDAFLSTSTGFTPQAMTDWSTSQVDNVEHIYQPVLSEGEYVIELEAGGPADCGIAWFGTLALVPIVNPGFMQSNGIYTVQATVSSNIPYQIEAATNLVDHADWEQIFSGSSASNVLEYLDVAATNHTRRFYRFLPEP